MSASRFSFSAIEYCNSREVNCDRGEEVSEVAVIPFRYICSLFSKNCRVSTTNQLNYRYTTRLRADESRPWENNMKFFDFLRKIPDFLTIFYVFLYFCDVANFEHRHRFLRTHHTMRRIFGLHPTGSSTNFLVPYGVLGPCHNFFC